MSKLIIVHASEAARHAADRLRGALETSPRIGMECVELDELGADAPASPFGADDTLLIVAHENWQDELAGGPAAAALERAQAAGSTLRMALLDEAAEPDSIELFDTLEPLGSAYWHPLRQEHWAADVADLVDELASPVPVKAAPVQPSPARQMLAAAALIAGLAIVGGLLIWSRMWVDTPAVVGQWVAQVDYGRGVVRQEHFEFRVTGGQIAGNASWHGVRRVIEGTVQDDERLSFYTRSHENRGSERRELRHDYVGIVAGDTIRFSLRSSGGFDEPGVVEFEARRLQ
jgi:hypothetical protein